jgi:hypothetical protein
MHHNDGYRNNDDDDLLDSQQLISSVGIQSHKSDSDDIKSFNGKFTTLICYIIKLN